MKLLNICSLLYCLVCTAFVVKKQFTVQNALFAENANSTFWTVPNPSSFELYSPSPIIPLIPQNLAKSILLSCYIQAIENESDVLISQCEETRQYMNTKTIFSNVPTPRFTLIGNDYLVGFLAVCNGSLNVIKLGSVLPLYGNGQYNVTSMLTLFRIQYDPCIIVLDDLSEYWKNVFCVYRLYVK